jgi:transformation/transcription domain-associated protein
LVMDTGLSHRCITLRGSNGRLYPFHFQSWVSMPSRPASDERMGQLFALLNDLFNKHKETRKRNIRFSLPSAVSFSPTTRLLQADLSSVSLQQVYEQYARRHSLDVYAPYILYTQVPKRLHGDEQDPKLRIYEEVSATVPADILSKFMAQVLPSHDHFFAFKRRFATQLALYSVIGLYFAVGNRSPRNIYFSKTSADMYHPEFYPEYNVDSAVLEWREAVPFRLTRNLQHFLGDVGIDGPLAASMTAICLALTEPKAQEQLRHFLHIFMRDEIGTRSRDAAKANVDLVVEKMTSLTPPTQTSDKSQSRSQPLSPSQLQPLNTKIGELVAAAKNPHNVARMTPDWLPPL